MHVVSGNPAGGTGCPRHGLPLHHHQQPAGFLHLPGVLPPQPAGKQWPLSFYVYKLVLSIHFLKSVYFWLHWVFTVLSLCVRRLSLVAESWAYSTLEEFLPTEASLVVEPQLQGARSSVVAARGLSRSVACGIFPNQGLN